jgi:V/A-type H+-transporting ATPase subunit D
MARQLVAPTKGNLLRLQEELGLAEEGFELLDHKREVLINELYRAVSEYSQAMRLVNEKLVPALELFRRAMVRLGQEREAAALPVRVKEVEVIQMERSVMGVRLPTVSLEELPEQERPGTWDGNADLDESYKLFSQTPEYMVEYIETAMSVRRLSSEIKKTQRQVNALETVFIPDYEETIRFIRDTLEENEREAFFRQKRVKAKLGRSGSGGER